MSRNNFVLQPVLRRPSTVFQPFICCKCRHERRWVSSNWLQMLEDGKEQWAVRGKDIRRKQRQSTLSVLEERGLIHDVAGGRDALDQLMVDKRIGAYVGIDPTAASLHVGHMLPFMALFWMYLHGFHAVSLIGGSTASIGDPTGRTTSRSEMTSTERKANLASIHYQLKKIWVNLEKVGERRGYLREPYWRRAIVNNAVWWNTLPLLEVMKYLGRGLRIGAMLGKDTVKTKMESGAGVSLAEFMYPVMQSWDWWILYNQRNIQLQIGGCDQYGNITSGIDAIKYIAKTHPDPLVRQEDGVTKETTPYGMTVPLLTTASGEKFGKSAGNAIWLDKEMTSVFDLYGFFVRTADADVERYLKLFTFLPLNSIREIMRKQKTNPAKRYAQHILAEQFVELVHGVEEAKRAQESHTALFQKSSVSALLAADGLRPAPKAASVPEATPDNPLKHNQSPETRQKGEFVSGKLNPFAPQTNHSNTPDKHIILPKSLVYNTPIARVLYSAGLVSSRSEGHRIAQQRGAYIGSRSNDAEQMADDLSFVPAKLQDPLQTWKYVIRDYRGKNDPEGVMQDSSDGVEGLLILRIGKWKVKICRIVSDEKFAQLNIDPPPPGWVEFKATEAAARQRAEFEDLEKDVVEQKVPRRKALDAVMKGQFDARKLFKHRAQEEQGQDGLEGSVDRNDRTPMWVRNMRRDLAEENERIGELEKSSSSSNSRSSAG